MCYDRMNMKLTKQNSACHKCGRIMFLRYNEKTNYYECMSCIHN